MSRLFLSALGLLLVLNLHAQQKTESPGVNPPTTSYSAKGGDELVSVAPADVGIDPLALESGIRNIIMEALDSGAFPGCQILLAKGGKVLGGAN